jgi:hypothetical protein
MMCIIRSDSPARAQRWDEICGTVGVAIVGDDDCTGGEEKGSRAHRSCP